MKINKIALFISFMTFVFISSCGVGFNLQPYFYPTYDSYDFGKTILSDKKFVDINIENHGPASLTVTYITIEAETGTSATDFAIDTLFDNDGDIIPEPYTNLLMRRKSKLTIRVCFSSDIEGDKTANLKVIHDAENKRNPYKILLTGCVQSMITPSPLDFGNIVSNVLQTKELRIDNFHTESITINKIAISSGNAFFTIISAKKNGVIHISTGYFAVILLPDEFVIVSIATSAPGIATRNGSIAVYHDINGVHSPIYGNLLVKTVENKPPEILAISTSKPTIKADGNDIVNLSVKVFDPNGLSDINSVIADMTPAGDTLRLMYDNGKDGDSIKDDGVYTLRFNAIIRNKLIGRFNIKVTVLDYNNATATDSVEVLFYTGNILEVGVQPGAYTYYNITSAIASASHGDYILVHNGTYQGNGNTDFNFAGKQILFRSENGAAATILNCQYSGAGVVFLGSAKDTTIMQGFKIINAKDTWGGGIQIQVDASPQILDCIIESCTANDGAGIHCHNRSQPILERLLIKNCTTTGNGGGIYISSDSTPSIIDCTIIDNTAGNAGGIYCNDSSPVIINTKIISNTSNGEAGGIFVINCPNFTMQDSIIAANSSKSDGGAVHIQNSDFNIDNCSFENNISDADGGGFSIDSSDGILRNCKLVNNSCDDSGGAVNIIDSNISFENCLVIENSAQVKGGGFAIFDDSRITIINNTISKNSSTNGGGIYADTPANRIYIQNSIVWANIASSTGKDIYNHSGTMKLDNVDYSTSVGSIFGTVTPNSGCINSTPMFTDTSTNTLTGTVTFSNKSTVVNGNSTRFLSEVLAGDLIYLDIDGETYGMTVAEVTSNSQLILMGNYRGNGGTDSGVVKHVDYHLKSTSPCINKGNNSYLPSNLTLDLDKDLRIKGSYVDLGPYEKQ